MLRFFIYGLTILHLGPGLAFVALAFGCDASTRWIGHICQMGAFSGFIRLTLLIWAILTIALLTKLVIERTCR